MTFRFGTFVSTKKQQAVFSAAQKVFCIGKQLARKGDESTSEVGAFRQAAPPRTNRNFQ